jgi:Flp pilus assembly protein TadG
MRTGSARQAGQSLVELAISAPLLVVLLLGLFNMGVLVSDKVIAGYATRQGARLAAQLGDGNAGQTTAQVDQQIVENVLIATRNLTYATVTEVDVYAPASPDGVLNRSGDPLNKYNASGVLQGTVGFPITARIQVPPNETSIGVQLVWQYAPTGYQSFTVQMSDYTVMKAAPVLPG